MKFNLQFFGEEDVTESVNESVVAEQTEVEDGGDAIETVSEEVEETPTVQDADTNRIYADARRRAEREAREAQEKVDAEYVRRFGNYKNPKTGEPIRSQADYLAALDAQEQINAERELLEKGVDPNVLNQMIQNNPLVKQASELIRRTEEERTMNAINADVAELAKLDPNIKSFSDVPSEVVDKCMQIKGLTLVDAYKLINYGRVGAEKMDAIRQSAINQAKGKSHLTPMNGVAANSNEVEIPASELAIWQGMFPDKSPAELRKAYNKQL